MIARSSLIGRRLMRDLSSLSGLTLLPAGLVLRSIHMQVIEKHSIPFSEVLRVSESADVNNSLLLQGATEEIREVFNAMRLNERVPLQEISENILPAIHGTTDVLGLSGLLSVLQSKDDYTYRHNIGVAVIATMIGKWLHVKAEELKELTLAATLHDVGKVRIPDAILNKKGTYTPGEYSLMKKHAEYGCEIIRLTQGATERTAYVALQHHEREDGSGYPRGIKGKEIDLFSKIVAVADVFHAMTSNRIYRTARPFFDVLSEIYNGGYGEFDTEVASVFTRRMMEMTIGSAVTMSDGRKGTVLMVHAQDPLRPLVQVQQEYVDLHLQRETSLVTVL